jgi:hypothetical protein
VILASKFRLHLKKKVEGWKKNKVVSTLGTPQHLFKRGSSEIYPSLQKGSLFS